VKSQFTDFLTAAPTIVLGATTLSCKLRLPILFKNPTLGPVPPKYTGAIHRAPSNALQHQFKLSQIFPKGNHKLEAPASREQGAGSNPV